MSSWYSAFHLGGKVFTFSLSCKTKPLARPLGIHLPKSLKCWAETEFQHTRCLICCFKGQLKGKERKRRIGRLLFRLLQHLQQLRQAWTRNPRSNPLTRSRITVSRRTQRELLFVRLYIFSTDLQTSWFWSELLHAAELHLCCITVVWGAKLASGNTKPHVDLSQHVTGDVLRTSRSEKEENISNNVTDGAEVLREFNKHACLLTLDLCVYLGIHQFSLRISERFNVRMTSQSVLWKMGFSGSLRGFRPTTTTVFACCHISSPHWIWHNIVFSGGKNTKGETISRCLKWVLSF